MKKGIPNTLFVVIFLFVFNTGCTRKAKQPNSIPENAGMVISFNTKSLFSKGKLDEFYQTSMYTELMKEIEKENKEMAGILDEISRDYGKSGIDFEKNIYSFVVKNKDDGQYLGFTAEMKSERRFLSFISSLFDKTDIEYKVRDENGIHFLKPADEECENWIIGWDQERLIMIVAIRSRSMKGLTGYLMKLMKLEKDESVFHKKAFHDFYKKQKDINIWICSDILMGMSNKGFEYLDNFLDFDIENNFIQVFMEFDRGEVITTCEAIPNKSLRRLIKKHKLLRKGTDHELLKYLPGESLIVYNFSIFPGHFLDLIEDQLGRFDFIHEKAQILDINLAEYSKALKGDFVMSVMDFDTLQNKVIPVFACCFNLNDEGFPDRFISKIPESKIIKRKGYVETEMEGMPLYLNIIDHMVLVTNKEDVIIKATKGGYNKNNSLAGTEAGKFICTTSLGAYYTFDISKYSFLMREKIKKEMDFTDFGAFEEFLSIFKTMNVRLAGDYNLEARMVLKDTDNNSLYVIIQNFDSGLLVFKRIHRICM